MTQPATDAADPVDRRTRLRRTIGYAVGLALLAAAVWAVLSQREALASAAAEVRHAPIWLIAAAALLPLVNWLASGISLRMLTVRRGAVGRGEMLALVGSAWLLNYLPMRAGMVGRIAYHKRINRITIRDSVLVLVEANLLTAGAVAVLLGLALALRATPGAAWPMATLALPGAMVAVAWGAAGARSAAWTPWVAAATVRYADLLVWIARYAVVFALIGRPLTIEAAAVLAAVSQAAYLIPVVGNGLGVREWGVGLVAAAWPAVGGEGARDAAAVGMTADLLNRAAEVAVAVPVGLVCTAWLARRLREGARSAGSDFGSGDDPADDGRRTE